MTRPVDDARARGWAYECRIGGVTYRVGRHAVATWRDSRGVQCAAVMVTAVPSTGVVMRWSERDGWDPSDLPAEVEADVRRLVEGTLRRYDGEVPVAGESDGDDGGDCAPEFAPGGGEPDAGCGADAGADADGADADDDARDDDGGEEGDDEPLAVVGAYMRAGRRWYRMRDGRVLTTQELARESGLTCSALYSRTRSGWPMEDLLLPLGSVRPESTQRRLRLDVPLDEDEDARRAMDEVARDYALGRRSSPMMQLAEIAAVMGVSRERVRQIEQAALEKLRRRPEARQLLALYADAMAADRSTTWDLISESAVLDGPEASS